MGGVTTLAPHGGAPSLEERTLRLDLRTLTWRRMRVRNAPSSLPDTPAACLAGGAPAWSESGLLREATAGLQGLIGLHL